MAGSPTRNRRGLKCSRSWWNGSARPTTFINSTNLTAAISASDIAEPGTAKITVAEVEHLVPAGELNPDHIHTPGIFVKRIVEVGNANKRIEFRNTRPRPAA